MTIAIQRESANKRALREAMDRATAARLATVPVDASRLADGAVNWTDNVVDDKNRNGQALNAAGAWIKHCVHQPRVKDCVCNLNDPRGLMKLAPHATHPDRLVNKHGGRAQAAPVQQEPTTAAPTAGGLSDAEMQLLLKLLQQSGVKLAEPTPEPTPEPEPEPEPEITLDDWMQAYPEASEALAFVLKTNRMSGKALRTAIIG